MPVITANEFCNEVFKAMDEARGIERKQQAAEIGSAIQAASVAAPSTAPVAPPPATTGDPTARLTKLREMRDQGLIDEQEFQGKKREILEQV
jgi:hypothetical protein